MATPRKDPSKPPRRSPGDTSVLDEREEEILERIASGESLKAVADSMGLHRDALHRWIKKDEGRTKLYQEARERSAEVFADEAIDVLREAWGRGPQLQQAEATAARELAKALQWEASKRDRKRYGEERTQGGVNIGSVNVIGGLHLDALRKFGSMSQPALPPAVDAEILEDEG